MPSVDCEFGRHHCLHGTISTYCSPAQLCNYLFTQRVALATRSCTPRMRRADRNSSIDSLQCSSPRKSLVKGERFIRGLKRNLSWSAIAGEEIIFHVTFVCGVRYLELKLR